MMGEPGLCGTCEHVKRTETKRGSVFYMCLLASRDATLRKYPPLPVKQCHGYQRVYRDADDREPSS